MVKNKLKPVALGIGLILATGMGVVDAKQPLVKNVVKDASPKHNAEKEPAKSAKHAEKIATNKQQPAKVEPVAVAKGQVKSVAAKDKKATVLAKAPEPAKNERNEKSVTRQILGKHQEQKQKLMQSEKLAVVESKKTHVVVSAPVKHEQKIEHHSETVSRAQHTVAPTRGNYYKRDVIVPVIESEQPVAASEESVDAVSSASFDQSLPLKTHRTTFYKIKAGDTVPSIFEELNLNGSDLRKIIHSRKLGRQFKYLTPGKTLCINTNARGELTSLAYKRDDTTDTIEVASSSVEDAAALDSGNETLGSVDKPLEEEVIASEASESVVSKKLGGVKHVSAHAVVQTTMEDAAKDAGLPKKIIAQLADIFAWDIDFAQNLRSNDQFTVVYEKFFENGRAVDTGDIVAAEFVNQGERHQAVRHRDSDGTYSYYTPEGDALRGVFLRNPLDFAKVSSFFNPSRRHPILNRIRAHKGVDYAASTGTPIKATGDGKISFKGRKGGYGQVLTIQHGTEYTTLYGHLSAFNEALNEGDSVKQGQIIGYVGSTGLATGPHLHYEFLVNGVHKDPLTVALPHTAVPINRSLLAYFKAQTRPLLAQLEQARSTMVARNMQ